MTNEGSKLAGNSSLWTYDDNYNGRLENDIDFGISGFTALPAGYCYYEGTFSHLGIGTDFWSATESSDSYVWNRFLFCYNTEIYRFTDSKKEGFSVRCIKD